MTGKVKNIEKRQTPKLPCNHLKLSKLGLGKLEPISNCNEIESIDLQWNCFQEIDTIVLFQSLWWLDLSFNQIKCLKPLSYFYGLGSLDLSNNLISWNSLHDLKHVHIIDLNIFDNDELQEDENYRVHVIDCLPRVWMLDGLLVTTVERQQVNHLFNESTLTSKPLRHRSSQECSRSFNSSVNKIFRSHAVKLSQYFSDQNSQNSETDLRRVQYIASDFDLRLSVLKLNKEHLNFAENMLKLREENKELCSVLLVLIFGSVYFDLPQDLMQDAFDVCEVSKKLGENINQLFSLSKKDKIKVFSLLLSMCKLHRDLPSQVYKDKTFTKDGMYDRLYLALYNSVQTMFLKTKQKPPKVITTYKSFKRYQYLDNPTSRRTPSTRFVNKRVRLRQARQVWQSHLNLLSSELVLLLSLIPSFYENVVSKNKCVLKLLNLATGSNRVAERICSVYPNLGTDKCNFEDLYIKVSEETSNHIEMAVNNTMNHNKLMKNECHGFVHKNGDKENFILTTCQSYVKRPKTAVIASSERLLTSNRINRPYSKQLAIRQEFAERQMLVGEFVVDDDESFCKILAVPDKHTALIQLPQVAEKPRCLPLREMDSDYYHRYINSKLFTYDYNTCCWRSRKQIEDKTSNLNGSSDQNTNYSSFLSPNNVLQQKSSKNLPLCKYFIEKHHISPFSSLQSATAEPDKNKHIESLPSAEHKEKITFKDTSKLVRNITVEPTQSENFVVKDVNSEENQKSMKTNEGAVNANTNNIDENSSTFQRQRTEAWQASCIDNDSVDPKLSDNLSTKQKNSQKLERQSIKFSDSIPTVSSKKGTYNSKNYLKSSQPKVLLGRNDLRNSLKTWKVERIKSYNYCFIGRNETSPQNIQVEKPNFKETKNFTPVLKPSCTNNIPGNKRVNNRSFSKKLLNIHFKPNPLGDKNLAKLLHF